MWKDFFYYSRAERRVILLLLILAVILVVVNLYGLWNEQKGQTAQIPDTQLMDSIVARRCDAGHGGTSRNTQVPVPDLQRSELVLQKPSATFDPNTASRDELKAQGLPPYVADNILKYRAKGGQFRTPESLQKIYGLDHATFESVRPRVAIGSEYEPKERKTRPQYEKIQKFAEGTIVNLNTADTATLKRVPGIGKVYASRIVAYRNRLGGFYSVDQLQDIRGLDSTLNKWFETGSAHLQQIRVNQCSLDELKKHPYLNYNKAKSIMDYRKRYGRMKDIQTLEMFETFTKSDLIRLAPYLSFE